MTPMTKINRICAWILLLAVLLYIVSGFDIQGRFLSPRLSSLLHLKYLFIPAVLAFAFHASYAMSQAFRRWRFPKALNIGVVAVFIALNAAFLAYYAYIQFIRP